MFAEVIDMKQTIMSLSKAKAKLLELSRAANDNGEAFILTKDGTPVSALVPMNEYEAFLETMEIEEDPALMKTLEKSLRDETAGRLWKRDKSGKWKKHSR